MQEYVICIVCSYNLGRQLSLFYRPITLYLEYKWTNYGENRITTGPLISVLLVSCRSKYVLAFHWFLSLSYPILIGSSCKQIKVLERKKKSNSALPFFFLLLIPIYITLSHNITYLGSYLTIALSPWAWACIYHLSFSFSPQKERMGGHAFFYEILLLFFYPFHHWLMHYQTKLSICIATPCWKWLLLLVWHRDTPVTCHAP